MTSLSDKIEPEDEIHFILNCSKLDECRKELFSYISSVVPSFNDMHQSVQIPPLCNYFFNFL
jgi:hypothetical protein